MAYNFKRLSDVESLAEVPESATVLAEVDGSIKRIPSAGLGGGKSLIVVDSDYTSFGSSTAPMSDSDSYTANMTFEEAYAALKNCELTSAVMYTVLECPSILHVLVGDISSDFGGTECLYIYEPSLNIELFWTADGLSTSAPSSGEQ